MIDLSKLSPISRTRVINEIDKVVCQELDKITSDLVYWKNDGSIMSDAGNEMVAWRNALVDLRRQLVEEAE